MIAQRIPVLSGGFSLAAFMAQQSDGFWYDFTQTAGLFQTTDTSTPVTAFGDNIGRATDLRAAATATQSTISFRPKYQTTGAAFDGTDDNLLTGYTAGSGANFLVAKMTLPAIVPGNRVAVGVTTGTDRFFIGYASTGRIGGGVGANTFPTIVGTVDRQGQTVVCAITCDGSTVRLFDGQAGMVYEAAQSGAINTSLALRVGAVNSSGTAATFLDGSLSHVLAGREFLDLARFNQIANALGG